MKKNTDSKPRKAERPDRRHQIVDAAIFCFIKHGVSETKLGDIARHAKIDQPLINYHFPSLDALHTEVAHKVLESLKTETIRALTSVTSPQDMLRAYIKAPFGWASKNPGLFSIWLYFYYLSSFKESFWSLNHSIRHTGRERICAILYQGVEKKVFSIPRPFTVNQMAHQIQGLITGNALLAHTEGPHLFTGFAEETYRAAARWISSSK